MKKVFSLVAIILMSFLFSVNVYAKDDNVVTVHVFYAEWCPNCQKLHKFLNELTEDKNYNKMFEIQYYRLDNEAKYGKNTNYEKNKEIYSKVRTYYEDEIDDHIPLYFIGDTFNIGFYPESSPEKIKKLIKKNYNSKNYDNVVQNIIDDKIDVNEENPNEKKEIDKTKIIGIVVIAITLIIAAVILIVYLKNRL